MNLFNSYLVDFLSESQVVKDSKFDQKQCVTHMPITSAMADEITGVLSQGGGDYFEWRGELVTVTGVYLVSNKFDSKLKDFAGNDIAHFAAQVQNDFVESINNYTEVVRVDSASRFGNLLSGINTSDHFRSVAIDALNHVYKYIKESLSHNLLNYDGFAIDSEIELRSFIKKHLCKTDWSSAQWMLENINIEKMALKFIDSFDVVEENAAFLKAMANRITYYFCQKRDFKAFSKFKFCSSYEYDFETERELIKQLQAFEYAFYDRRLFEVASCFVDVDYSDLTNLGLGKSVSIGQNMQVTSRSYGYQITIPSTLVHKLQLFLLKYNREGMLLNAA